MTVFTSVNDPEITRLLLAGKIGVLRTDTLYGVVARADDEQAVKRVYELKGRDETKSPIVLVQDRTDIFDDIDTEGQELLNDVWPGKVSVILPSTHAPVWIRRNNDSVAYRLPHDEPLQRLLNRTGPLIAPSANPEGQPPAMNITEAQAYFGGDVDFYVDGGTVTDTSPSQIIKITADGTIKRLR